jgi:thiol-disulfide isomerase/thioredoxin
VSPRRSTPLAVILLVLAGSNTGQAQTLTGMWDATVVVNELSIPFSFQIAQRGTEVSGSFFNGDEKVTSRSGLMKDGQLILTYPEYGATLMASVKNGQLEGQYVRASWTPFAFHARRFTPPPAPKGVPDIAGLWNIQLTKSKRESAWHLVVRQSGAEVSAAILRVDGDTGTLTGRYTNGRFVLGHFDGARPDLVVLTPKDGGLEVVEMRGEPLIAIRSDQARARGLPEPADPTRYTSVKDPAEPFRFSFRDVEGRIVSNTDPRFVGKVVIVDIGGSWCPNCHDEAPFLNELYRRYRSQGLEIVLLSFEEGDQLSSLTRLRAFIKGFRITYTVLVPGQPSELAAKIPQAVDLVAFPTAFFLGRDGTVRGVQTGFAGRGTVDFHSARERETITRVERLLAESVGSSRR